MTRQRTRAPATSNDEDSRLTAQTSRTRRPRPEHEVGSQSEAPPTRRARHREPSTVTDQETSDNNSRYGFRKRGGKHPRFSPCCTDYVQRVQIRRTRSTRTSTYRAGGGGSQEKCLGMKRRPDRPDSVDLIERVELKLQKLNTDDKMSL